MTDISKEAVERWLIEAENLNAVDYPNRCEEMIGEADNMLRALSARVQELEAKLTKWRSASALMVKMIDAYQASEEAAETVDEYTEVFRAWDRLQDAARDLETLKGDAQ